MKFKTTEETPTWLKLVLGEMGLPEQFDSDELTDEQHLQFQTLEKILDILNNGTITPLIKNGRVAFLKAEDHKDA